MSSSSQKLKKSERIAGSNCDGLRMLQLLLGSFLLINMMYCTAVIQIELFANMCLWVQTWQNWPCSGRSVINHVFPSTDKLHCQKTNHAVSLFLLELSCTDTCCQDYMHSLFVLFSQLRWWCRMSIVTNLFVRCSLLTPQSCQLMRWLCCWYFFSPCSSCPSTRPVERLLPAL